MFLSCSSLGIDVGNHSIRVAFLQKGKQGIRICNLVEERIDDYSFEQIFIKIKQKLKEFSVFPYLLPKHQIMAVSQSQVAIKRFSLNCILNLPEQEQYMQIGTQLSESLGLPHEELLYDYYPLSEPDAIQVYACRRVLVEDKLTALANAGYRLSALELQTQSLMRLYYKKILKFNNKMALLVDIDFERIQFLLGDGQAEPFYRELPWYGKRSHDLCLSEKQELTGRLSEDILRQYQQINTQFSNINIKEIWLCGEGAAQIDVDLLSKDLDWDASLLNPFDELKCTDEIINKNAKEKWATAIGLALRGISDAGY